MFLLFQRLNGVKLGTIIEFKIWPPSYKQFGIPQDAVHCGM